MYPVAQFQPGIPENIEDLLDHLFYVVAGDLLVDDHQVDIGVDTELLTAVRAQCDKCQRNRVLQWCIIAEHISVCDQVYQFEHGIDLFGMFDKKVFSPGCGKALFKCVKVAFYLLFEDFGYLKMWSIGIK